MLLALMPLGWIATRVTSPSLLVLLGAVGSLFALAYSVLLHGFYGQTVGKRLLHVRVLDVRETPLSMRQAFLRDSPLIAMTLVQIAWEIHAVSSGGNPLGPDPEQGPPAIFTYAGTAWFAAEIITMLFNAKRRAIHDWIAGSVVVRT